MAWYKELFAEEDPLRFEMYGESDASRADVDFAVEKLAIEPGARVLDLCCGQGRHLLDLMRRGYDVVGVDLSEFMLGKCREAAAREGLEPHLLQMDMRDLSFDSEFEAAINMWTSFGYLESDEEDQKVLDGISRALRPGGRLLLEIHSYESRMRRFQARDWRENLKGDIILSERAFDQRTGRINSTERTIHSDGRRTERCTSLRIYTCRETERMMSQAGLTVESVWGDLDSSPLTIDSKRMLTLAVKPLKGD